MKIGDSVRIKNTIESTGYFGCYVNSDATVVSLDTECYCHIKLFDGKVVMSPVAYIEPFYTRSYQKPKCECGAKATSFPNFHADYCPAYKRYS